MKIQSQEYSGVSSCPTIKYYYDSTDSFKGTELMVVHYTILVAVNVVTDCNQSIV